MVFAIEPQHFVQISYAISLCSSHRDEGGQIKVFKNVLPKDWPTKSLEDNFNPPGDCKEWNIFVVQLSAHSRAFNENI